MSRIFDALRKAQAGRPEPEPLRAPVAPPSPPDLGPRGLAPPPSRRQPERAPAEAVPAIVPIREAAGGLPDELVREMTRLRVSIESLLLDRASRSVMFVSAQGREGTSTVAYQFAFTLARDARIRTLFVDAHAHRPTLFAGPDGPVPSGIPGSSAASRAGESRVIDGWPLAEQHHAVGLLSATLVREVIEWASGRYEWVVFDGPPVLESADAAPIAAVADGAILVVESGRTKRPVLQRAVELLRKAGGHVMGSVLNRRRLEIPEFIYRRI